jgi:predicted helicase
MGGRVMTNHIHEYFKSACEAYSIGNIETSYNAPIMALMAQFGCNARDLSGGRSGQAGENPDIKIWRGDVEITETEPFAMIEVKKIGGIDARAKTQVKKGASLFGYAILTDNRRWEFWRAGESEMYSGVQLMDLTDGKLVLNEDRIELFISLIQDFLLQDPAQIRSSSKLAEYMAIHAKTIRAVITGILKEDGEGFPLVDDRQKRLPLFPELYGLFSRIKADLRPLLNTRSFADMYAQTIVYGLFIARYNDATTATFNRYEAISRLQEESALLNRFFEHITNTGTKHPTLDSVIDKLCALYQICDISALLSCEKRGDTIVHFYEDFLTYYDPALRKSLGVFYTPHQVVRYLVSMVDKLLVEDFGITGGLSNNDQIQATVPCERYEYQKSKGARKEWRETKEISVPRVAILDPATGTGTFHAEIIKYIRDTYFSGVHAAFYDDYIKSENGLLSRMIGFEIMMTSYAVAHLNVRRTIEETLGQIPNVQLPTNIFMTNTLAPPNSSIERNEQMSLFDFSAAISDEAYNADTWKIRRPIKVIIGNPPYLAASTNPFDISAYKTEVDGKTVLQERNSKLLGDDYVKFFCFSEQIINKNNEGVLAFVTNNGFLENPTFRGMRASLLRTFDKIFVVNLHGSSDKKEVAPDGSRDENIFDIMRGISLFIGMKKSSNEDWAKVFHTDIWGTRKNKFQELQDGDLQFTEISPDPKMAFLVPYSDNDKIVYDKGISIADLFLSKSTGVKSGNDDVAIAPTRDELLRRLDVVKHATDEKQIFELFGRFSAGQTAQKVQNSVLSDDGVVTPITYRPFDSRWTFYTGASGGWLERPREVKIMGQLTIDIATPAGKNIGLVFARCDSAINEFTMAFISDTIIENRCTSAQSASAPQVAPLFRFNEIESKWESNFSDSEVARLTAHMSDKPTAIEIFDYIYGILYDPIYRRRFDDYLSRDFPRVPVINAPKESDDDFIVTEDMFRAYVTAGERLRKLHLMQTKIQAPIEIAPPTATDLEIGAIKYKDGILQLNPHKQITGIPEDVWNYRIGGYQVLDKWFKSHKGMTMTINDFHHIANIVGLLGETIKIQENLRSLHKTSVN